MGALRKTMEYLGLSEPERVDEVEYDVPDESYDDMALEPVHHAPVTPISAARSAAPGDLRRIATVHPRTYNDAKVIGESFRSGTPVIMNLTDMSEADAKRLVDFSAGLVFGLHGTLERVTPRVFLLSPSSVEVASDTYSAETGTRVFNQS
ncbi:MAG TPA: cell division protein SepF [Micrococcales bacterium]|uniref:Cell division protein SepF n=1 Tax=Miniimonas arenae TaxID=676201 RepID=A0A5C5BGH5_9MICO|nr:MULTISPECIES: cell division protein SepF [Miniimonas]TNU77245.1 cell division protein SepF [Miniimonas arenae]HCX83902.1 cell division protein SepF [Micrococcales bacterium]